MQKYKRPRKYPGMRSIPLRNPRRVDWHANWDGDKLESKKPQPITGPTDECFADVVVWNSIKEKPKFVVIERRIRDTELRLYFCGSEYFFAHSKGEIRWSRGKTMELKRLNGEF